MTDQERKRAEKVAVGMTDSQVKMRRKTFWKEFGSFVVVALIALGLTALGFVALALIIEVVK